MGSRWRQMLMDYGQVLGNEKMSSSASASNSAFFTLGSDLSKKKTEDMQLRATLELHFRPLFQRYVYGGEKIACHDLRRLLRDPEYRDRLPPDRVHELADLADFNMGKAIKYDEFVRMVLGTPDHSTTFGSEDGEESGSLMGPPSGPLVMMLRNTTSQVLVEERVAKYRWLPPPFFMITITIIQIVMFIVYSTEADDNGFATGPLYGLDPTNKVMYIPNRRHEAWRFFTYCFLHQGYIDLIFNVLIQLILGFPLEITFSFWRMMIVYFAGVITGSLGHSMADRYTYLAGSAGGSYAIMMAHCVQLWQNRKHLNDDKSESSTRRCLCSLSLRFFCMIIIFIPQVALAVYRRWFYDDVYVEVGIAAHIGGLVAGFLLGQAFLKDPKRYPWQVGAGWFDLFTFLIFVGAAVIFNICFNDYPLEDYS